MAVHKLLQYPSIIACLDVDNYVLPIREDQGFLVSRRPESIYQLFKVLESVWIYKLPNSLGKGKVIYILSYI